MALSTQNSDGNMYFITSRLTCSNSTYAVWIISEQTMHRQCTMFRKNHTGFVKKDNIYWAQCFTITLYYVTDYWYTSISSDKHQTIITMPKLNIIALSPILH